MFRGFFGCLGDVVGQRDGLFLPLCRLRGLSIDISLCPARSKNYHLPFLDGKTSCATQGTLWTRIPFRNRTPRSRTALVAYHVRSRHLNLLYPEGRHRFGGLAPLVLQKSGIKWLNATIRLVRCCLWTRVLFG